MFDLCDFIFFSKNNIEIGIDFIESEKIFSSLNNLNIKKEYIYASVPRHTISCDQFFIKKKLITVNDFSIFINESSYVTNSENEGWGWVWNGKWIKKKNVSWEKPFLNISDQYYNTNADILPVMQVSWNDALAYTKWLSEKTGKIFRLPFEYEWEMLAKYAGYDSIIKNINSSRKNIPTDEIFILQLKEKLLNSEFQLGLLWEWMIDWYAGYDKSIKNKDFGSIYKTLRGGSILSEDYQRTKEFRFRRCPTARSPYYGFRIVLIMSDIENPISA